jgi:hypothetical protein
MPMRDPLTSNPVQLLDLLLDFFADDARWIQGDFEDADGRRCLVGAVRHFSAEYRLPKTPVMSLLEAALPQRQLGLIRFNDERCRSAADLRRLILKARAFAVENAEHEQAAEAFKRQLLAQIEREQAARAAAGDYRKIYILSPRTPEKTPPVIDRLAA